MSNPSNNSSARSFLRPKERALIVQKLGPVGGDTLESLSKDPPEKSQNSQKIKSDIQTELAEPSEFKELIERISTDLTMLQTLQLSEGGEKWAEWQTLTLPQAKSEIESLRNTLNSMLKTIEQGDAIKESDELKSVIGELRTDLDFAQSYFSGGNKELLSEIEFDDGKVIAPSRLVSELEEYATRIDIFLTLLGRESNPFTILEDIHERGRCRLHGQQDGDGEYKGNIATRDLVKNELATKDEHDYYEIEERGEVILQCWQTLKNTSAGSVLLNSNSDKCSRKLIKRKINSHIDFDDRLKYSNR